MNNRQAIAGMFALLALANAGPRRRAPPAIPPKPPSPRSRPMPERPEPSRKGAGWVLVQMAPTLQVLAMSESRKELEGEMAELFAVWSERGDRRVFDWRIVEAVMLHARA